MATEFGWVFMGMSQATKADYQSLESYMASGGYDADKIVVDKFSECGRLDPFWTAMIYIAGESSSDKMGGIGSHTYETQQLTDNYGSGDIEFMASDKGEIWHINPDGERVFGVMDYPRTGAGYHVDAFGQSAAGPKPGTSAEKILGDGKYDWDKVRRLYKVI